MEQPHNPSTWEAQEGIECVGLAWVTHKTKICKGGEKSQKNTQPLKQQKVRVFVICVWCSYMFPKPREQNKKDAEIRQYICEGTHKINIQEKNID